MISIADNRVTRILTFVLPAMMLAGCFGKGEGPDPIAGTPAPPPPPIPPGFCDVINFEDVCGPYTFTEFEGGPVTIVDNPDISGLNTTDKVARMQKFRATSGRTFGGSTLTLPNGMDFSNGEAFTMLVWSSRPVPVLFKFEGLNQERSLDHSGSGMWEELCFDFTGATAGPAATGISFIFDIDVLGDAANDPDNWTFFFDEITQVASCGGGGGPTTFSTVTFDDPAITYALRGFGGAEDSTVVVDPTDAGNNVVQVNRSDTAETFAGTVVSTGPNESVGAIPLDAANTQMTVRVWSPAAGIPVRLKIENSGDPAVSVETEATTTVAMTWETLTFDFANEAAGTQPFNPAATYDKVVIFFNFGTAGATAGAQTFYFDDIDVGAGPGPGPGFNAVTFDDPAVTYTLRGFGGAEDSTVVVDPTDAGNNVVQVNRSAAAETFAGTVVSTGPNESVGAIPLDAANTQMTVRVWSPAAGIPVRLKIENSGDPAVSVETEATTTAAMTWETLTFDFANEAAGTQPFNPAATYDKVVIFFNFGTAGATAGAQTFYFDDIDVGAGPGPGPGFNAVTFDDPAVTYTLRGFGGAEDSTVVVDPTDAGNNVVQVNRSAAAETFAGTVVSTGPNESIDVIPLDAANTQMNVRVWSPAAGIPVRLKIENSGNAAISVETEATTTVAMTWETLTFDFANEVAGTPAFDPAATYDKVVIFFNFGTAGATAGAQTFYFDNIDVGPGPGASGGELAVNGDFETGTLAGWEIFDSSNSGNGGTISVVSPGASGTFAGNIIITAPGNPTMKQPNLAAGQLSPNQVVTVTFDWKGTDANGGVANIVLFSELSGGGVSDTFTIFDGAGFPADWTTVGPLNIVTGNDVSGGVTLQIAAICGGAAGCISDVSIDNVSITVP